MTLNQPTMRLEEASVRLDRCRETLRLWIKQGRLKALRPGPRCTLVLAESVEALERELKA